VHLENFHQRLIGHKYVIGNNWLIGTDLLQRNGGVNFTELSTKQQNLSSIDIHVASNMDKIGWFCVISM